MSGLPQRCSSCLNLLLGALWGQPGNLPPQLLCLPKFDSKPKIRGQGWVGGRGRSLEMDLGCPVEAPLTFPQQCNCPSNGGTLEPERDSAVRGAGLGYWGVPSPNDAASRLRIQDPSRPRKLMFPAEARRLGLLAQCSVAGGRRGAEQPPPWKAQDTGVWWERRLSAGEGHVVPGWMLPPTQCLAGFRGRRSRGGG